MSDYEKLEQELLRCGWTPKFGRGDHVKFYKEGALRPIPIAKSISSRNRSYKNTLADIRKVEPSFMLDEPTTARRQQKTEPKPTAPPLPEYAFIRAGEKVRYVAPENRNYDKLVLPDSVMNLPYVVQNVNGDDTVVRNVDDKVLIDDGENGFVVVGVSDLDAWELRKCNDCGKSFPVNTFRDESGLCCKCAQERIDRANAEILKNIREEKKQQREKINAADVAVGQMEALDSKLPKMSLAGIKGFVSELISIREGAQFDFAYSIRMLGKINEYIVKLPDREKLSIALNHLGIFLAPVLMYYKGNAVLRMVCENEDFDQYVDLPMSAPATISRLEKLADKERLGFLDTYANFNFDKLSDALTESGVFEGIDEMELGVVINPISITKGNRIDLTDFEGQPGISINFFLVEEKVLTEERKTFIKEQVHRCINTSIDNILQAAEPYNAVVAFIPTRTDSSVKNIEKCVFTEIKYVMDEKEKAFNDVNELARRLFREADARSIPKLTALTDAIDLWIKYQDNNLTMNEDKYAKTALDEVNASAEDERLADVTTRELLKELRARGVEFENLTVPVVTRCTVSIEEL